MTLMDSTCNEMWNDMLTKKDLRKCKKAKKRISTQVASEWLQENALEKECVAGAMAAHLQTNETMTAEPSWQLRVVDPPPNTTYQSTDVSDEDSDSLLEKALQRGLETYELDDSSELGIACQKYQLLSRQLLEIRDKMKSKLKQSRASASTRSDPAVGWEKSSPALVRGMKVGTAWDLVEQPAPPGTRPSAAVVAGSPGAVRRSPAQREDITSCFLAKLTIGDRAAMQQSVSSGAHAVRFVPRRDPGTLSPAGTERSPPYTVLKSPTPAMQRPLPAKRVPSTDSSPPDGAVAARKRFSTERPDPFPSATSRIAPGGVSNGAADAHRAATSPARAAVMIRPARLLYPSRYVPHLASPHRQFIFSAAESPPNVVQDNVEKRRVTTAGDANGRREPTAKKSVQQKRKTRLRANRRPQVCTEERSLGCTSTGFVYYVANSKKNMSAAGVTTTTESYSSDMDNKMLLFRQLCKMYGYRYEYYEGTGRTDMRRPFNKQKPAQSHNKSKSVPWLPETLGVRPKQSLRDPEVLQGSRGLSSRHAHLRMLSEKCVSASRNFDRLRTEVTSEIEKHCEGMNRAPSPTQSSSLEGFW
ncbi:PREDICTED: uncharacterized protein LOC106821595 isoform X2 [Priapulus caudatus]|uniref:Uncharacterized protein LOC106821595 isoform X2 n=1 Tax=Priapulus caudatus TaxID=37621 RepID=A0ABM1FBZ3_PRICU|nr:PREDICTED: uncharacterized protein LOC106821595 isoform X2 [Priapulus caudatus]